MKINTIQNNYLNLYKPKIIQRKSKNGISYNLPENSIVNSLNILYTGKIKPWNFERIKEIYNEIFPEFLSDHPYLSDIGYKKPKLIFSDARDNDNVMSYSYMDNTISVYPFYKDPVYCYENKCKNNDYPGEVTPGKNYKKEVKKIIKHLKTTRLNDSEKELYYKSCLMHELRHSAQTHVLFSTDKYHKKCLDLVRELYKEIQMRNSALIQASDSKAAVSKKDIEAEYEELKDKEEIQNIYAFSFKPNKSIADDVFLKFSTNISDKRYWSTGGHLYKSYVANAKNTSEGYFIDPTEIDAYNYQFEFIKRQKPKHSIRPDIYRNLQEDALFKSFFSTCLERTGYPDFIIKQ